LAAPESHSEFDQRFRKLQELLFEEDGQLTDRIQVELDALRQELRSREDIDARVEPFFDEKLEFLKTNFPDLFGAAMAKTIKQQIRDSQDEMIDALYPIIGRLIRRFVAKELERLTERIDHNINETFSWKGWVKRFRRWFQGESFQDQMMRDMVEAEVEEVFIVDKESGLLAGAWSREERADQDMVAGMLTAIKSFVESAFEQGAQDLETIEYETYKIILHNFQTYYVAVIVSGVVSSAYKTRLRDFVMAFEERYRVVTRVDITEEVVEQNSLLLKERFDEFTKSGDESDAESQ